MGFFRRLFGREDDRQPPSATVRPTSRPASKIVSAKKEWYVLRKGQRKEGPFSVSELRDRFQQTERLRLRKSDHGRWVAWDNAGGEYPELAEAGVCRRPKKRRNRKPS